MCTDPFPFENLVTGVNSKMCCFATLCLCLRFFFFKEYSFGNSNITTYEIEAFFLSRNLAPFFLIASPLLAY